MARTRSETETVEADERSSDQIDPTTIAALGCIEITFHTGRKTNLQKRKTKPYDWFVRESVSEEALKGKAQSLGTTHVAFWIPICCLMILIRS